VSLRRPDAELWVGLAFAVLVGIGWWLHSVAFALVGMAGVLATAVMYVWQRECLTGVSYRRTLGHDRALFGEEVSLEVELVNDKLLPLTWLRVEDRFPQELTLEGGTVVLGNRFRLLVHLLPMFPFQRVRRRMTIVCTRRGVHTIGPAELQSGDPIGYRQRYQKLSEQLELLVYPKVYALDAPPIASRELLGNERTRALLGDPSRVAGVREYRSGDPLRYVDWRATARSTGLLVREFDSTASLRMAVFADLRVPQIGRTVIGPPELEFTIAVTATIVSDFLKRDVAVGLYSSALVGGRSVSHLPSRAPSALAEMLELLAKASPLGGSRFGDVLISEGSRLLRGTSVVLVAAHFPEPTLVAIAEIRRQAPVTAIWIGTSKGTPPPDGSVDSLLTARFTDDWQERTTLELAS
jgi:uncharacterized protein (DUF58 family)